MATRTPTPGDRAELVIVAPRPTLAVAATLSVALLVAAATLPGCGRDTDEWLADVRSPDEYQRLLAVVALGRADPSGHEAEMAAELVNVLEDPEPEVKAAAKEALTLLAPRLVDPLVHLAATADVVRYAGAPPPTFVRQSAAAMAEKAGAAAIPRLLEALLDPETLDRGLMARTLGRIGEPAIEPLIEVVNGSEDPFARNLAAMGLADALAASPDAARRLVTASGAGDARSVALDIVRESLKHALPAEITPEWTATRLKRLFGDDPAAALQAEIELRLVGEPLVPVLVSLLEPPGPASKQAALLLLRLDAKSIERAFQELDPSRHVHAEVLERLLLAFPEPERLVPLLDSLLSSGRTPLAQRAIVALRGLGAKAAPALPTLRFLATRGPEELRAPAAEAVARIEARLAGG